MRTDDLIITIAYFSIPIQILISLGRYPRLTSMPPHLLVLLVLFALFIFLCGAGHMLRCLDMATGGTAAYETVNGLTALVSMATALYLVPLIPTVMSAIDESIHSVHADILESRRKLFTFMSFLCHEIRNPLFAITATIPFLEDSFESDGMSEENRQYIESISSSTNLMLRLVNDVLDLSKIESGKLELEEVDFQLRDVLRDVASLTTTLIRQRPGGGGDAGGGGGCSTMYGTSGNCGDPVKFEMHLSERLPPVVVGDSVRVLQILYNLLSNAAKFTERGNIDLYVDVVDDLQDAVRRGYVKPRCGSGATAATAAAAAATTPNGGEAYEEGDGDFALALLQAEEGRDGCSGGGQPARMAQKDDVIVLKIQVKDTGVGIAADRIPTIFEPYTQSKLSDYRTKGGTGLGLSILQQLSSIMGGSINVQSLEDVGSKFTVYLPLKRSAAAGAPANVHKQNRVPSIVESRTTASTFGTVSSWTPLSPPSSASTSTSSSCCDDHDDGISGGVYRACTSAVVNEPPPVPCGLRPFEDTPPGLFPFDPLTTSTNAANIASVTTTMTAAESLNVVKKKGAIPSPPSLLLPAADNLQNTTTCTGRADPTSKIDKNGAHYPDAVAHAVVEEATPSPMNKKTELLKLDLPPNDAVVLVVDDNALNRKLLARMLDHFNVEYKTATNGKHALDIIDASRNMKPNGDPTAPLFGLILMDMQMPVLGGTAATKEIRRRGLNIPVVALTANALDNHKKEALEAGATKFMTKPILRPDLYDVCRRYLSPQLASSG